MLMVGSNEIGGGFVRRPFTDGTRRRVIGEALTAAEIKAYKNHNAMIRTGYIAVYPPATYQGASITANATTNLVIPPIRQATTSAVNPQNKK